jgi:hypothetical protein
LLGGFDAAMKEQHAKRRRRVYSKSKRPSLKRAIQASLGLM